MTTSPTMSQPTTEPRAAADGGALTLQKLQRLAAGFGTGPAHRLAQNAVTQNTIDDVALNRSIVTGIDHTFSHLLDDWTVTNQKKSGRCWLFAGLNLLRVGLMKKMNLKEFEFSQNHALFFDKLERANYFLEAVIETADRPVDDRTVAFLLDRPLDDGGQWNMFVNVVRKHGLVPKAFMPETESSSNTRQMNAILLAKLREGARTLRELRGGGAPMEAARAAKDEILAVIHRILCIHLGTPPQRFPWQWNDKDKEFHRDGDLTPQEFAQKYVELPLDEYVCLVNDPRESSPYGRTFTVQHLGNVVDGEIVKYLNVEMDLMKDVAMRAIMGGEPVWFGCDVGKMMRRDMGIWDAGLYDYESVYDTTFELGKAGRLLYHQTLMTHAMLFTGVDVVDDRPRRWRVENSWGDENGRKGFFTMNDSWFEQHMFEIAAVLPPWDPMGSLAG
jgi:bleomycin hydrolase